MTRSPAGFQFVLVAVVVAVICQMTLPEGDGTRVLTVVLQGLILLLALHAAGADPKVTRVGVIVIGLIAIISALFILGISAAGSGAPRLTSLILALLSPVVIAIGLRRDLRVAAGRVTTQAVLAGLCFYLLLGMSFAFLFSTVEAVGDTPFFSDIELGTPNDFMYYSYTALTTTGFGDLTAAGGLGRALSVTEALAGQIYLVTVLAILVSNLGKPSLRPGDEPDVSR